MGKHLKGLVSLISAFPFFALLLIPSVVTAHDNISVHPYIAKQAFFVLPYDTSHEIYQYLGMNYNDNSTGGTACADAETGGLIAEGAKEEDDYDPLLTICNEEYLYGYAHHFYKYDTGKGLFGSGPSALDYAKVYYDRARQSYADGDRGPAYWYLGRIAHLIADVSVPAHVLDDPHAYTCKQVLGKDSYEFYMSDNFLDYSAGSMSGFEQLPVIMSVDDIFTQLASHTAAYPSDDINGTDASRNTWNDNNDNIEMCDFLPDRYIADENLKLIGSDLMPQAIKYTAALYQLFWLRTHDQGDTTATASDISVGAAEYAEIYPAGDHDFFRFAVTAPGKYSIYTRGTADTFGVLYNGSYGALTQDNDSGELDNFRIQRNIITPGTYYIEVTGGTAGAIGNYELHVDKLTPPNPPVVSSPSPTKDTTPTWTWKSGGGGSGTFRYKRDNADLTTGATVTTATSFTPLTPLAEGTHTLYVQERAAAGNWSASGSKAIVIDTTVPTLGTIRPTHVTTDQGRAQTFTAIYSDEDGYGNLKNVELQVGTAANGSNAIWARYTAATNKLSLFNNAGTTLLATTCTPGLTGSISNSQGTLNCLKTTVEKSGNNITVNWKIRPKAAFAGATAKNLKMRATDRSGLTTGLIKKGSWTITSAASAPQAAIDQAPEGTKWP